MSRSPKCTRYPETSLRECRKISRRNRIICDDSFRLWVKRILRRNPWDPLTFWSWFWDTRGHSGLPWPARLSMWLRSHNKLPREALKAERDTDFCRRWISLQCRRMLLRTAVPRQFPAGAAQSWTRSRLGL